MSTDLRAPAGRTTTPRTPSTPARLLPGLLVTLVLAAAATGFGMLVPVVGAPVTAIVLGAALRALLGRRRYWPRLRPGAAFAGKYVLQAAVVVFGLGLSLRAVARVGVHSLPVMLGTLAVCLLAAWLLGRVLGVSAESSALIGAGTGICGASAIGAVTPVIAAGEATVAYAVSTIFLYNVAAVLVFPPLGHLLGLGDQAFGLWAGTAVNDTSSVVAAGFSYSAAAGNHAVIVKLVRSLMIIPVVLGVAALWRRRRGTDPATAGPDRPAPSTAPAAAAATVAGRNAAPSASGPATAARGTTDDRRAAAAGSPVARRKPALRLVPVFLWLFLLAAAANTVGLVPAAAHDVLSTGATFLVAVALAGIGTGIGFAELRRTGPRPLLLGGILWVLVAVSSLALQALLGLA